MKKIILYNIFIILIYSTIPVYAQHAGCGTELLPAQTEYMNATREARKAYRAKAANLKAGNVTINIPIVAHIIRQTDGTGGLSDADAITSIQQLNDQFDDPDLDVFFEHCVTNHINDDDLYEEVSYAIVPGITSEYVMASSYIEGAVNVFFVPNPTGWVSIFPVGGWASFPAYKDRFKKDWIVMSNSHATNGSTLAHEVGHYFNLYHTHQGPTTSGEPFSDTHDYELPDGEYTAASDMSNIGDELYDTPADPILIAGNTIYVNDDDCLYDPTIAGSIPSLPTGYTMSDYDPDVTNIMSYSDRDCTNSFSSQQKARMLESIDVDRNYLETACNNLTIPDCYISDLVIHTFGINQCNDNNTPNNPNDDWESVKAIVYYKWAEAGMLNVQTGIETSSMLVPEGRSIAEITVRVPANGQPYTVTAYFSNDATCSKTINRGAISACSIPSPCGNDVDADNDGVCSADDCDDNNAALPTTPGISCNDGNPNTTDDVILNDGCTCQGTAIPPSSDYCIPNVTSDANHYISGVTLSGVINNGSGNDGGYRDFTTTVAPANILPGDTYSLTVFKLLNNNVNQYWRVWIDYNQDGVFDDNTELVVSDWPISDNSLTRSFTVPAGTPNGTTRMRVYLKDYVGYPPTSCGNDDNVRADVEDYAIVIGEDSCEPFYELSGIINSNTFRAQDYIESDGQIPVGNTVTFQAGNLVHLLPGFTATAGASSKFHALIDDCTPTAPKQEIDTEQIAIRNYPNPFTGQTTITFSLPKDSPVTLFISDVTGRQVATLINNEITQSGTHQVTFDGIRHTAGVYYYTIQAGDYTGTQKMILVK